MASSYSNDLRERVAASVLAGRTCAEAALMFSVSVASAARWSKRLRETGSADAHSNSRDRPRSLAARKEWLLSRLDEQKDLTLRALVTELDAQGIVTSYGSVWRIVHDAGLSFKKNSLRHRARSA
jgi:transposase